MPSKYWEDSADLSRDSSAESDQDPQDSSGDVEEVSQARAESERDGNQERNADEDSKRKTNSQGEDDTFDQNANIGALSRVMAANFQLPTLQSRDHASLFYLSLIEGRCRTQALALINAGRPLGDCVAEDHPEVSALASHLFAEMSKELLKAGMIPEEFVGRPLPELRLYLSSFDTMVSNLASTRPQNLPEFEPYRAIDSNFNRSRGPRGSVATLASSEDSLEPATGPQSFRQAQTGLASGHQTRLPFDEDSQRAFTSTRFNPTLGPAFRAPFNTAQASARRSASTSPLDQPSYESAASGDYIGFHTSSSSTFDEDEEVNSRALVLRDRTPAMSRYSQLPRSGSVNRLIALMSLSNQAGDIVSELSESIFETQYKDQRVIGKGGFGKVYSARYYLDNAEYAIKKIVISAAKANQLYNSGKLLDLVREVRALAKLHHPHIVRYHHSWLETCASKPKSEKKNSGSDFSSGSESGSESGSDEDHNRTATKSNLSMELAGFQSISLENYAQLDREFRKRSDRQNNPKIKSSLVFENDSPLLSAATTPKKESASGNDITPKKKELSRFFDYEPKSDGDNEEDDGDEKEDDERRRTTAIQAAAPPKIDFDTILLIKMTYYPLSLADYIEKGTHCFHPLPTVLLLRKILAGVSYLHRKNIIHRDLKPGNIFLGYPEEEDLCSPSPSFIDTTCCPTCSPSCSSKSEKKKGAPKYISPCIGDFGLVADLKGAGLSKNEGEVGTSTYTPAKKEGACEKLDVYALGVIALELSVKFGTASERAMVLRGVKEGKMPVGWEEGGNEVLGEGVRGMLCAGREERWGCERVGAWLEELEGRLGGEMLDRGREKGKEVVR